jgi:hypothetical protein
VFCGAFGAADEDPMAKTGATRASIEMPRFLVNFGSSHRTNLSPTSIPIAILIKERVISAQHLLSINIAMGIVVGAELRR